MSLCSTAAHDCQIKADITCAFNPTHSFWSCLNETHGGAPESCSQSRDGRARQSAKNLIKGRKSMTAEQLWHPPPPQDLPSIQPILYGNFYAFSVLDIYCLY